MIGGGVISTRYDITNQKFNKLTALYYLGRRKYDNYWQCRCDCGSEVEVAVKRLLNNITKSCGCLLAETKFNQRLFSAQKLIGDKRDNILVVGVDVTSGNLILRCLLCGNEKQHRASRYRAQPPSTCKKCAHTERKKLSDIDLTVNSVFRFYKGGAKARGIDFTLTEQDLKELVFSPCFYCGSPPLSYFTTNRLVKHKLPYQGIDRQDNNCGYTVANVVACCKICNYAKRKMTTKEFVEFVSRAFTHLSAVGIIHD